MVHFQEKFRSALWLVQVTPDLPRESLRGDAAYYYKKVKEIRPHGPYRLATYSGTHLIGFLIAEMMLNDGEQVIQLSLLDHTPSLMFSGLNQDSGFTSEHDFDITDKEFRERYKERAIHGYFELAAREDRTQVQKVFMAAWQGDGPLDAWQGRPAPDHYVQMARATKIYIDHAWDFVAQLPSYQSPGHWDNTWQRVLFAVEEWLKGIELKVPVTVYVASRGVIGGLKDPLVREKWSDLGIRRCFSDARVVQVESGHGTIMWNETVIKDLQQGHPAFRYTTSDGFRTICWAEAVQAFHNASKLVHALIKRDSRMPVVAILASLDAITYFALVEGIMRTGCTVFPISTRNSDAAVAHLLKATDCKQIFVSSDVAMQELAAKSCARVARENGDAIVLLPTPTFSELFEQKPVQVPKPTVELGIDLEDIAIITHSSGSTSDFPKPVTLSHRDFLSRGRDQYYGEVDFCDEVISIAGIPMFHSMGLQRMPQMALAGCVLVTLPPSDPPIVPTPENAFQAAVGTQSTITYTVPSMLEEWAKDSDKVKALTLFKRVQISGGPLAISVGDMLVEQGVKVMNTVGS
ncbi:hypothetical protein V5O48_018470 [Marasmius crinis-equi]|uniref:AMP-dependent synthetase/ligase domain-containing protein n=1 Tax=Marasmius crinis-equi TaxID=585013 RepID=A0ABR3EL31_9AGAR